MNAVRWGVLGAANIAVERVIPAIAEAPSASMVAIGSRDEGKAQRVARQLGIPRAYGDYAAVLDDPDVDAVYVPLPNHLHVEWSIRALQAGKHVLCEKPLCLTSAEARKLIQVQRETGLHLEEGLAFRSHPQWERIEALLGRGSIGQPVAVHGTIAKRFLDPADIRNNPAAGGGAAYDLGIYVLTACSLVFQRPPLRVAAAIDRDQDFGIDRLTSVLLDYGSAHATLTAASQAGTSGWATHQLFSVLGSNGWLRSTFPYAQARPVESRLEVGDETSVGALPTYVEVFAEVNQYALQIENFSRLIRGLPARSHSLSDALVSIRTIEAIFEAAQRKSWVDIEV